MLEVRWMDVMVRMMLGRIKSLKGGGMGSIYTLVERLDITRTIFLTNDHTKFQSPSNRSKTIIFFELKFVWQIC